MQFQSSYIFLPNPYSKKPFSWEDENGVLHIETGHSVYTHVKKAFPSMTSKELTGTYFQYEYSFSVQLDGKLVDISIISKNVGDSYFVTVLADGKTKAQLIEAFEYVHSALFATEIEEDYISIVSYDAVSEYYCNKLYPKLNRVERNLRKLLFNIYVLNFGKEYFEATTTKEMRDKAKSIIQAKGGVEKKEIQYIKEYFYSMEYADIQQLLFAPRWTKVDEEDKKSFLDTHEDLSKLPDVELRAAINGISPKSDWERFFDAKFQGLNVEKDIETVRVIRNRVAHCKFMQKEQYDSCNKTINALNKALNRAITITEEKDFDDKNAEYLRKAMSGVSNRIQGMMERLRETVLSSAKSFSILSEVSSSLMSERLKNTLGVSSQLSGILKNVTPTIFPKDYFISFGKALDIYSSRDNPFQDIRSSLYNPLAEQADDSQVAEDPEEDKESEGNEDA